MWELLMNNDDNSVDVIICTYDRYKYLDSAIESVLRGSELVLSKLIVADNTPSCEARDAFSAKYASVDAVEYMLLDTPGLLKVGLPLLDRHFRGHRTSLSRGGLFDQYLKAKGRRG
jgi:hypothetical protein